MIGISHTCLGCVKCHIQFGEQFLKKLNLELTLNIAIIILSEHLKDTADCNYRPLQSCT